MQRGKIYLFMVCCLLLLMNLSGCKFEQEITQETATSSSSATHKDQTPVVFIHGYSGGMASFGGMIKRFEDAGLGEKTLVVKVLADGSITSAASETQKNGAPLIQVLFADNKSDEWHQAEWIYNTLRFLKEKYQITKVYGVGHSMGGVSLLRYLTSYGKPQDAARIIKFVAIGAPFNQFEESVGGQSVAGTEQDGPLIQTDRYKEYAQNIGNYPKGLPMLNIAGDMQDGSISDGTVPVQSVAAINHLLENAGVKVDFQVAEGRGAQHSQLHENAQVDQLIAQFLWSTE